MIKSLASPLLYLCCYFAVVAAPARAEILQNTSFETVPGPVIGQGILPSNYVTTSGPFLVGADTYSNDGSYGLAPGEFGNFPGLAALDGIRFVAGADFSGVRETFGQVLAAPLTPGATYTFSASLLQSPRFATAGGYELILSPSDSYFAAGAISLGSLAATTATGVWQARSLGFVAPPSAASLPYFILAPYVAGVGEAYIGIDQVSLTLIPEPSTLALTGLGLATLALIAQRRRTSR